MNQKENKTGIQTLAGVFAVLTLFSGISTGTASGMEASWIVNATAGISHTDNVNNASSSAGKRSDEVSLLSLSGGGYFQVADYTGIAFTVDLEKEVSANYTGLSLIAGGVTFRLNHKMGLGPSAVRLNAYTSASDEEYGDSHRNSLSYKAGISGSRWIGERVKAALGYEFDKRTPKNNYVENCASSYGGYGGYCQPSNYTDVYDIQGHTGIAAAEITLTEKDTLLLSYRYRHGDVISVDVPTLGALSASSAVSGDGVFPTLKAYRISAAAQTGSIGISREIIRKMSLNLNYSFNAAAGNGGLDYRSNVLKLMVAYSF